MSGAISHDRQEETPEAKACWFQSLPLSERMDLLCFFTDLILANNPRIVEQGGSPDRRRGLGVGSCEQLEVAL